MPVELEDYGVPRTYDPLGFCMYCGKLEEDSGPLETEHILADGLGGRYKLPKSSCRTCAAITGSVEQRLLRGPLWPLRRFYGLNSSKRPKKAQPDHFDAIFWRGRERVAVSMKSGKFPLFLAYPSVKGPSLLAGKSWDYEYENTNTTLRCFDLNGHEHVEAYLESFETTHPDFSGMGFENFMDISMFRRLIAKTVLSNAYAVCPKKFTPICRDFILGGDEASAGELVGEVKVGSHYLGEWLNAGGVFEHVIGDRIYVAGMVVLFNRVQPLCFVAVVGVLN